MFPDQTRICIVLTGSDPALDQLGRELAARLPGAELGSVADASADINYYIPLGGRREAAPTREAGWVSEAQTQGAVDVDLVICASDAVREALGQGTVIAPAPAQTWAACADAHKRALEGLMARDAEAAAAGPDAPQGPVALLLHGDEHKSLGGPSVRVPRTAQALRAMGIDAQAGAYTGVADIDADLVHLFNVWNPDSALLTLRQLKAAGKRVVFSPIYLDLRARSFWEGQLPDLPLEDLAAHRSTYHKALAHLDGRGRLSEPVPGYNAMLKAMLDLADHVIFLSQAERDGLAALGAVVEDARASLVPNPVDAALWQTGDGGLFHETYLKDLPGPQDYVICVGRIEERKNQLLLARALRDVPVRLVLVGHAGHPAYAERVRRAAGPDCLIVDRLDPSGEMLRSAVAGARVFCLPSWSEGASLAALEAAAAGAQMVLGARSSEQAYFGDLATYCDVGDPDSIAAAVTACLDRPDDEAATRARVLKDKVAQDYSWSAHAGATAQAYAQTTAAAPRTPAFAPQQVRPRGTVGGIVLDLTALAQSAKAGQVAQADALLARALVRCSDDVRFICWNDRIAQFVDVPATMAVPVSAWRYCARFDDQYGAPQVCLEADCTLVVAGEVWHHNAGYLRGLEDLKARSGCAVMPLIYGLDPLAAPYRYPAQDVAMLRQQFHRLVHLSDGFLPVSEWTARQTRHFAQRPLAEVPQITPLRLGDPVAVPEEAQTPGPLCRPFAARRYVLAAGPVTARANLEMLLRVWARFAETGQHGDLHLVIAGDVTGSGGAIPERIARDPQIAHRVHILGGLDAAETGWLYRHCLFSVFAAHSTDRALPVVQSLAYGKPCLASSVGATSEIASDLLTLIDPQDFVAWHSAIAELALRPALREAQAEAIRAQHRPTSWDAAAQALIAQAQALRAVRLAQPVFAGARLLAGTQAGVLQLLFGTGWHPAGDTGRRAAAPHSYMTLNLSRQAAEGRGVVPVLLHLDPTADGASPELVIRAGKEVLFEAMLWRGEGAAPCDVVIAVPVEALDAQGCVTLCFDSTPGWTQATEATPARYEGIGLASVVVLDPALCNPLQVLRAPDIWSRADSGFMMDLTEPGPRAVQGEGQAFSSAWGLGSSAGRCDIAVPVLPRALAQGLSVTCRPVACADHPVTVTVFWNNRPVAEVRCTDDSTAVLRIALSAQDMAGPAPHMLSVRADSLLMPADLGLGSTEHIAGVGVFDVALVPEGQTE